MKRLIKGACSRLIILPVSVVMLHFGVVCPIGAQEMPRTGPSVDFSHGPLQVSENGRYLIHRDGTPFFYLGDTAWELFHRLDRKEAEQYFENRRAKGFTVIQAAVLAELDGLNTPNAMGDRPLIDNDPTQPNEPYFQHVDYIVKTAAAKGLFIGMLPTWGDKFNKKWGIGPEVFTPQNARVYGTYLGRRYREQPNIIWILGGDRNPETPEQLAIIRAMAAGLRAGDGGRHLITYHPQGGHSASEWFRDDPWLDFTLLQSGHSAVNLPNYQPVVADYRQIPVKPCMDGEPRYEDHPVNWNPENGWFTDADVRQAAYWGVFAGGHGHTYGYHNIWQMYAYGREPVSSARHTWYNTLDLPGAWDMQHLRDLMESRPFLNRVPDQSLIAGGQRDGAGHLQATRGAGYLFVYIPLGSAVTIHLGIISGTEVQAWWFNPRSGEALSIGTFPNRGTRKFKPFGPEVRGNDWILVIDDADRNYPAPRQDGVFDPSEKTY